MTDGSALRHDAHGDSITPLIRVERTRVGREATDPLGVMTNAPTFDSSTVRPAAAR